MGNLTLDDYNLFADLMETWRLTTDWVKMVMLIAMPCYLLFLIHQVLRYRIEQRAIIADIRETDSDIRRVVEAQMREIVAEWERKRSGDGSLPRLGDDTRRH